jgi:hypothetical protein
VGYNTEIYWNEPSFIEIVVSGFSIDEGGVLLRRLRNSGIKTDD